MFIPMGGFIAAWIYPLYVNIFNKATMDIRRETNVGIDIPITDKEAGLGLGQTYSRKEPGTNLEEEGK